METGSLTSYGPLPAAPYAWPYDGRFDAVHTAVICIDGAICFIRRVSVLY